MDDANLLTLCLLGKQDEYNVLKKCLKMIAEYERQLLVEVSAKNEVIQFLEHKGLKAEFKVFKQRKKSV